MKKLGFRNKLAARPVRTCPRHLGTSPLPP